MRFPSRLLAVSAIGLAAACGGGGDSTTGVTVTPPNNPTGPTTPSTPSSPVVTTAVNVSDDFFDPANIQVSPGATVTWTWTGTQTHNVTFSDGGSGDKGPNASFSKTFATAGTFTYNCTLHGGMNGTVLVK